MEAGKAGKPNCHCYPISRPSKPTNLIAVLGSILFFFPILIAKLHMLVGKKPVNEEMYIVQHTQ